MASVLRNRGEGSFRAPRNYPRVNCQVGEVDSDYSEAFERGLVMWQKPGPGAVREDGTKVELVVGLGRKQ